MEYRRLLNGVEMPEIGFGTYKAPDDEAGMTAVKEAVEIGYRLFDTATLYENEAAVGRALRECGVSRDQLFVTTKVANSDRGYDSTLRAFDRSLQLMGLDYMDLYLIHWPASEAKTDQWRVINAETWRAMEELLDAGRVRAIGVSNFFPIHLDALMQTARVTPMVNQVEMHPGLFPTDVLDWSRRHGMIVEAWSPLGRMRMMEEPLLLELAAKYGKSVAQICLRWEIQHGVVPIPKSMNPGRMKENFDVFNFSLSADDMEKLDRMPPTGCSGLYPDTINF